LAYIGAFTVLVDAKNEPATGFWRHLGFVPFADHPLQLYLPMKSIANLLSSAGITVPARSPRAASADRPIHQ
jgi:hypothetical protein